MRTRIAVGAVPLVALVLTASPALADPSNAIEKARRSSAGTSGMSRAERPGHPEQHRQAAGGAFNSRSRTRSAATTRGGPPAYGGSRTLRAGAFTSVRPDRAVVRCRDGGLVGLLDDESVVRGADHGGSALSRRRRRAGIHGHGVVLIEGGGGLSASRSAGSPASARAARRAGARTLESASPG